MRIDLLICFTPRQLEQWEGLLVVGLRRTDMTTPNYRNTDEIPADDKLSSQSVETETDDDELPDGNVEDRRKPPMQVENAPESIEGLPDADPDRKDINITPPALKNGN
jgi:hypothetical protein